MKLLFVHDVKALLYKDEVYARSYGKNIWERYLNVFDQVTVCTRSKPASETQTKGIDKITGDKVSFDNIDTSILSKISGVTPTAAAHLSLPCESLDEKGY